MNSNIQSLAEQAGDFYREKSYMFPAPVVDPIPGEFLEKFAELLVKECMSFCDETSEAYLKHRKRVYDFNEKNILAEGESVADALKGKMKQHFGIK